MHTVFLWETAGLSEIAGNQDAGLEKDGKNLRGGKCRTAK
jgi:hypothetical protein